MTIINMHAHVNVHTHNLLVRIRGGKEKKKLKRAASEGLD